MKGAAQFPRYFIKQNPEKPQNPIDKIIYISYNNISNRDVFTTGVSGTFIKAERYARAGVL